MTTLFTTILNMSMTASIVALAVMIVRFLLQKAKAPKIFSYALWGAVLFRLVFPFSIESIFSLMPTFVNEVSQDIIFSQNQGLQTMEIPSNALQNQNIQTPANTISNNALPHGSTDTTALPDILEIIGFVWLIGFIVLLTFAIIGYIRLKKRVRFATLINDNVFETDKIKTPFVLGFIHPKTYFPIHIDPSQYDYILKHEQTHIKRFDYLIKPFAYVLLALHWFNPIIWFSYFLMSKDMEMSCDEAVLRKANADIRQTYSYSLLNLSTEKNSLLSPISFGANSVKGRVINVLNFKETKIGLMVASIIMVACVLVACSLNPVAQSDTTTPIIRAEGPIVSERFEVEDFTTISISNFADIVFRYADEHAIVVETSENLLEYLNISVQDGTLEIEQRYGTAIEWGTTGHLPEITIYAPHIEGIILDGSATVIGWDIIVAESFFIEANGFSNIDIELEVEQLHINMSGSNNVELSGSANIAYMMLDGFCHIFAFNLLIQNAQIQAFGSSHVNIYVSESLDVTADGFSEVQYMGEPLITPDISGGASISRATDEDLLSEEQVINFEIARINPDEVVVLDDLINLEDGDMISFVIEADNKDGLFIAFRQNPDDVGFLQYFANIDNNLVYDDRIVFSHTSDLSGQYHLVIGHNGRHDHSIENITGTFTVTRD